MTKVEVFTNRRQRQQRGRLGYDSSSPDFRHSKLKIGKVEKKKDKFENCKK